MTARQGRMDLLALAGNPNLGVYVRAIESHVFIPVDATAHDERVISEALGAQVVRTSIGGTRLLGALLTGNSRGLVAAAVLSAQERRALESCGLPLLEVSDRLNAVGNTLLITDKGALVGPEYPPELLRTIASHLDVEITSASFDGLLTVGKAAVATNKGVLVHPKATPDERETARTALGADVMVGTVNHGSGLIGAGVVANSKGALVGKESTGIELGRVEEALGLYGPDADTLKAPRG